YQEVRIQGLGGAANAFSYVAGFSYNHSWQPYQEYFIDEAGAFGGPINAQYLVYDTQLNSDSYGVYGQATRRFLSDRLGITAGVRIDYARRSVNQKGPSFLGPGFMLARDSSRALPKFALDYRVKEGVLLYASAASGWKPRGVNPYAGGTADALFDAEHNWAYEGGLKSSYLNQRVTINLAGFYNDITHYQASVVNATSFQFEIGNANNASIKGGEVDVSLRPVSKLEIHGGYGLARARFGKYILNPLTGFNQNGQHIGQLPDSTGNVVVQYRLPGNLVARAELIAASNYEAYAYSAPSGSRPETFRQATIPGSTVGNLRVGYLKESSRWEISGYINNVTNERYFLQAAVSPPTGYAGFFGFLGLPRTYGFRGTYRFH
ncbi:MAG: TonB-dependent receptor, partial [Acidobacteria bacterium]|nr:TonB-dependent receptor [Acidobacteriota bacterium]